MAVNYQAMIQKYSWWQGTQRLFIVVERHGDFNEEKEFIPTRIVLVENLTNKATELAWKEMVGLIEEGKLKEVTKRE